MNKRHYEHTLPNIRGSLSNTYFEQQHDIFSFQGKECGIVNGQQLCLRDPFVSFHRMPGNIPCLQAGQKIFQRNHIRPVSVFHRLMDKPGGDIGLSCSGSPP